MVTKTTEIHNLLSLETQTEVCSVSSVIHKIKVVLFTVLFFFSFLFYML